MYGGLQGKADKQVLEVFRDAYEEVRRGYNEQLINERKVNLAAILLDVANKEGDPSLWPPQSVPLPSQSSLAYVRSAPIILGAHHILRARSI